LRTVSGHLFVNESPRIRNFTPAFRAWIGHRWFFMRWSAPMVKRRPQLSPLPPPSHSAEQFGFYIHVKYDGVPVYSRSYDGSRMKFLLDEGARYHAPFSLSCISWQGRMELYGIRPIGIRIRKQSQCRPPSQVQG
jgi:hypothetical protein